MFPMEGTGAAGCTGPVPPMGLPHRQVPVSGSATVPQHTPHACLRQHAWQTQGMFEDQFELPILLFLIIYSAVTSLLFLRASRRNK